MATVPSVTEVTSDNAAASFWRRTSAYDEWIESTGFLSIKVITLKT